MDKDNYARLMREAADASAEEAKESLAFEYRQAFYDGVGFANKMRRDQTEKLIKILRIKLEIYKTAKAALDFSFDDDCCHADLQEALSKIMSLCSTTPDGEGG